MAWQDVEAKLRFWNPGEPPNRPLIQDVTLEFWETAEIEAVKNSLHALYANSPTAKSVLNKINELLLVRSSSGSKADPSLETIAIDFNQVSNIQFMSLGGTFRSLTLERLLIHEIIHAEEFSHDLVDPDSNVPYASLDPRYYNHVAFNHLGDVVEKTNQVMVEMGEAEGDGRASYDVAFALGASTDPLAQLDASLDYAPFAIVDFAYGDLPGLNQTPDILLTAGRSDGSADLLFGFDGNDTMKSGAGADYLYGGRGDDTLFGGSGVDLLHGGDRTNTVALDGVDSADYSEGDDFAPVNGGITITFDLGGPLLDEKKPIVVSDDGYGTPDYLYSIEKILGTSDDDTVEVQGGEELFQASKYALSEGILPIGSALEIDGGEGKDTLDFTSYSGNLEVGSWFETGATIGDVTFKDFEVIEGTNSTDNVGGGLFLDLVQPDTTNTGLAALVPIIGTLLDINYYADGVEEIYGNGGNDHLVIGPDGRKVEGGAGNDLVLGRDATYVPASPSGVIPPTPEERLTLDGGSGTDWVIARNGVGAITVGGPGQDFLFNNTYKGQMYGDSIDGTSGNEPDVFWWSGNTTFLRDAGKNDILQMYGVPLTGGTNTAYGTVANYGANVKDWLLPFVGYAATDGGQLLISTRWARGPMVVENYDYGGFEETLLGIAEPGDLGMVFRIYGGDDLEVRLFYVVWGHLATFIEALWTFAKGLQWKTHDDPLVLDLDGDGIETSTPEQGGVHFDLDNDFFSEKTGWVKADDGLLVWDQDGNRRIDDSTELFGSPGTDGFTELAALDDNADGVIDANDANFTNLEVWRDLNQDGRTDQGELFTLAELDITSLGAVGTEINHTTPNGNLLREQATYTRGDGTTGNIYEAIFQNDQIDTQFRGERGLAEWERSAHTERIAA